jgi:Protein of unknown function, DUF547
MFICSSPMMAAGMSSPGPCNQWPVEQVRSIIREKTFYWVISQKKGVSMPLAKKPGTGLFLLILLLEGLCLRPAVWGESPVDHSLYGQLLKKYVREGVVDYRGFKNEETVLDQYLKLLENTETKKLSSQDQYAFYVNAYNAWTIKLILSAYPGIKSIKELGGFLSTPWKKKMVRIEGQIQTLDDIEHEILRKRFKDPRIHFAVNCASKGCPPLRSEPYQGNRLDQQLDEMTIAFLNDPARNFLKGDTLFVSSLFKWYAEDFNSAIVGFFLKYARGDLKNRVEANRDRINVKYLDYDWSLNDR